MKIKFVAIKQLENNAEAIALAEKVKEFINGGWVHEFEPGIVEAGNRDGGGTFETGTELFTKLWEVQNTYQGGDRVFTINNRLEEEDGWLFDAAWVRCGRYSTDRGFFNQDSGTITIAMGDDIEPFIQVDVVAECSRNSLREHVLLNLLEVCGFTKEDWDSFDVDKQSLESGAPEDMRWWELRDEYVTRQLSEGKMCALQSWLNDNNQSLMEGSSGQYKLDCILDGFFHTHPEYSYNLRQTVQAYVDDLRALSRMRDLVESSFSNGLTDLHKRITSKNAVK